MSVIDPPAAELEARLIALERHVAEQEKTIEDLNAMVTDQWRLIDRLKAEVERLKDRLGGVEGAVEDLIPDQRPPHY